MDAGAVIALGTGCAGAGAALGGAAVSWRRVKPESESLAVGTLRSVLEELRDELLRKEEALREQRSELSEAWRRLALAESHLRELEQRLSDDPPPHLA